jgi:putative transposase
MTDNGSPMLAAETRQGLERLSILHKTTLPYSPEQNGKQESFWGQIEGRLMAMLEGEKELTLKLLNEATIAWVEMDYHRRIHSEIGQTPLERFLAGPDVARPSPSPEELQMAFTVETTRSLRRSDCTISLEGRRYEVPSSFRHLKRISVRFAHWNLSNVLHVSRECGDVIGRLYPRDLEKNSSGARRRLEAQEQTITRTDQSAGMAPLLEECMKQYSITGLPMAYIPKGEEQ